uniref:Uncharacterized protein n=1 Tax=Arundo donax TaxID=35708 RepID=A0A0A9H3P1_ARUDO
MFACHTSSLLPGHLMGTR